MFKELTPLRRSFAASLILLLAACASQAPTVEPPQPRQPTQSEEPARPAEPTEPAEPPAPEQAEVKQIPNRPFDADTLYALLVAEIAGSRNRFDVAVSNYVQQALATQDIGVTARAARIARLLNAHDAALEMAFLWIELEPESSEAHFIAGAELAHRGQLVEAAEHSAVLLELGEEGFFDAVAATAAQADDQATAKELRKRYAELLQDYPDSASLHLGQSLLLHYGGELEQALAEARRAAELEPDNVQAYLQESQILQEMGRADEALQKLADLVSKYPDNQRLRLQYARFLAHSDLPEAQNQFQKLVEQSPGDPDFIFSLGLIQLERGLLVEAAEQFKSLTTGGEHSNSAHYYLGKVAEARGDLNAALNHYRQVSTGAEYLPAVMRAAEILVQMGDVLGAMDYLQQERERTAPQERDSLYLLEAEVLSATGDNTAAMTTLNRGLAELPQSTRLLYARAMLFTLIDKIGEAEQDLKQIILLAPDNAAALNALGYTLADRTDRLHEAYGYIRAALELTPHDGAVLDSMGWVNYRLGNYDDAVKYLRQAMAVTPDHEIAAHLGEVLWVTGAKKEARDIWRTGLEIDPASLIIRETLERLNVELGDQ